MKALTALIALALVAGCSSTTDLSTNRVAVTGGEIEGLAPEASGVRKFLGIPFAASAAGENRWREPQPVAAWEGVREAKAFGANCLQLPVFADIVPRGTGPSEDCLYLNVWTPANSADEKLPVLFYIYGGGYMAGDGSEMRYDGEALAAQGIIVVTMNYRLGAFGFMAHPELSAETPHRGSGNYGLLDQIAALRWTAENIAAFGGDPERITIAGESAGSISASALMASPLSREHVAGAIGESGSILGALSAVPLAQAEANGVAFAQRLGASSLAALRALPADQILQASGQSAGGGGPGFSPTIDNYVFPKAPRAIYEAGEQAHAPLLVGSNSEEASAAWLLGPAAPTVANYRAALAQRFGEGADAVFAQYPAASDGEAVLDAAQDFMSDSFIAYSTWSWIEIATRTGGEPSYYYYFAQPRPNPAGQPQPRGAAHAVEIDYAMGNLGGNPNHPWTETDHAVSEQMQRYFVNFVKTGDPNGEGLPQWPAYSEGQRLVIDANTRAVSNAPWQARYQAMDAASQAAPAP